ncbi:MAG: aminodeoxychorismate lyase, partial [Sulfurovum sp.]|nr:aminodeoxychorismate lyase [Sulfurovum sp.]
IIQKEAASEEEMPLVSSVIYNRLNKGMRLQMDGTLNYGKYSHMKVTPERIKNDETKFNTYKHKGLPSSPIGAVSLSAILAAIKPAKTDYLYFMKNKEGVHDFSKSYKTHRKNIRNAR